MFPNNKIYSNNYPLNTPNKPIGLFRLKKPFLKWKIKAKLQSIINEAKGNQTFKDKFVKLTGVVQSIDGNFDDTSSVVKIDTPDDFNISPIWCNIQEVDTQSNNIASKLSKGDSVVLTGKVDGILMGSIMLKKCKLEE